MASQAFSYSLSDVSATIVSPGVEARTAVANGKVGVGALLLWRDEILVPGHNMYVETGDITTSAEIVVLHDAAASLSKMK